MRMRSQRIVVAALAILGASALQAHEIPILPSGEEVSKLSTPSHFKDSNRQQLTRSVAVATPQEQTAGVVPIAAEAPIDVISIDVTKLRAPASIRPGGEVLVVGGPRPAAGPMTLQVAGETFELAWVAETSEPSSAVRHESMQIRNVPGGYARFTISGEDVVGTIVTPQTIYRIAPYGAGQQAVFRAGAGNAAKYQRKLRDDSPASHLERRHVQVERIAEIQPHYVDLNDAGRFLRIRGGQLGRFKGRIDEASILGYLRSLNELANLPADTQIRREEVKTFADRKLIVFHQMIAGIPVRALNELQTDAEGTVTSITTHFVDPQTVTAVRIPQREAQQLAVKAIENKLGITLHDVELIQPTELYYDVVAEAHKTMPIYAFYIGAKEPNGSRLVFVNATTGETWIAVNPQDFGWNYCIAQSGARRTCSEPGAFLLWYHRMGGVAKRNACGPSHGTPTICQSQEEGGSEMAAANRVLDGVQVSNPTVCCNRIGGSDHTIDVVRSTPATTSDAEYNPTFDSILSRPGSLYLDNPDVLWHEFSHGVLYSNSTYSYANRYGKSGEYFTTAFIEAFADLTAAAIALQTPTMDLIFNPDLSSGDPWIIGDGSNAPGRTRNLNDPSITSFYHLSTASNPHDAGRAISKYLYNVVQSAGLTPQRFAELLLQLSQNMSDGNGTDYLDLMDLKAALLASARANESALVSAINGRFDEMYNNVPDRNGPNPPIGVPTSATVPPPPYPVTVQFTGNCPIVDGARTSDWRISWSPSPFAVSYIVFAQQINGPLNDVARTSSTFANVHTNVSAYVSVSACGANGACGGSSVRVQVSQRPECNF